jgi:hypothetical protein
VGGVGAPSHFRNRRSNGEAVPSLDCQRADVILRIMLSHSRLSWLRRLVKQKSGEVRSRSLRGDLKDDPATIFADCAALGRTVEFLTRGVKD